MIVDELRKLRNNATPGILFNGDYEPQKKKKGCGAARLYAKLKEIAVRFKMDGEKNKSMDASISTSNGFPRQLK
jgi:hypothetical protein